VADIVAQPVVMLNNRPVILCVDDEESVLYLRSLVLQNAGYLAITASSGTSALDALASTPVDLVLSDYLMPDMDGVKLTKAIKARNPNLPVLLISAVLDFPPGAEVADGFLNKLIGPDLLCNEVSIALKRGTGSQL
jgi:CheY-like chemotaxis protein